MIGYGLLASSVDASRPGRASIIAISSCAHLRDLPTKRLTAAFGESGSGESSQVSTERHSRPPRPSSRSETRVPHPSILHLSASSMPHGIGPLIFVYSSVNASPRRRISASIVRTSSAGRLYRINSETSFS